MTDLYDVRQRLRTQLAAGVHAALTSFGHHLALVTRTNPLASADDLLARPDVAGYLNAGLSSARTLVSALVRQAWEAGGGPSGAPVLQALLQDVSGAYGLAASSMRTAVRDAFTSVPVRQFETGVSVPGSQPLMESAAERAAAAATAIRSQADRLVVSGHGSLSVAGSGSRTAAVLEEGHRREAAGEHLGKRWMSRLSPVTCRWCRALHGVVIPLDAEFDHGEPYEAPHEKLRHVRTPAGARHFHREIGAPIIFTYPPRVWGGQLLGPCRHPGCECWLELVVLGAGEGPAVAPPAPPEHEHPFVRASDIAAMPDAQYHSLLAFLTAATHELRLLIRRLLGL